jgi:proline iminopeptidase
VVQTECYVNVPGGRVWCRTVGSGPGLPLLVLHGGPGFTCEYLDPLAELGDERAVVLFDQLGCGRSDRPSDPALWTVDRFVDEVACVRRALGLDRIHLLGQSWGSMLAVDAVLAGATGIASLILASPPLSIPLWMADAGRLRAQLPPDVQLALTRHEASGYTACPEYRAASLEYSRRFICRADPWPDAYERSFVGEGEEVYHTMWGPNEFTVTGTLAGYDRTDRLPSIDIPTLLTCGRFDEATPESTEVYAGLIPGSRTAIFERSAHCAHLEEKEAYLSEVRSFLAEMDARPPDAGTTR